MLFGAGSGVVSEESAFLRTSRLTPNTGTHTSPQSQQKVGGVILSARARERFRGPEERQLFGAGSGVVSEESAFLRIPNLSR